MTETLLLDTCAAIWIGEGDAISAAAQDALERARVAGRKACISPISAWEVGMLSAKNRLTLSSPPVRWYSALVGLEGIEELDLSGGILVESSFLPGRFHGDPADRIIVATARAHGLTIMTRDEKILGYAAEGHVRAMAC